jgi:hypothetical protein
MGTVSGRERYDGEGSEEDEPRGEEAEGRQEQGHGPGGGTVASAMAKPKAGAPPAGEKRK